MKFLFIIQGEGRGHMTQAISLAEILRKNNHEIVCSIVGESKQRAIPSFLYDKIPSLIETIESPNFVLKKNKKGIRVFKTIIHNLVKTRVFFKSIARIHEIVQTKKPDVIVNFCELLGGLYFRMHQPQAKKITLGHHYYFEHPAFTYPKGKTLHRWLLHLFNKVSSFGSDKVLALSMSEEQDIPQKKLFVVPPLLRIEIRNLVPIKKNIILGYMLNPGYFDEIMNWHRENPAQKAVFFWDKKSGPPEKRINPNLTFYQLNDNKYIEYLNKCKGVICTSGFESVCEAMFLEKPVMVVPSENHYEQLCNAKDSMKNGAGIQSKKYNPKIIEDYIPMHKKDYAGFKTWVLSAEQQFLHQLTLD